MQTLTSVLFALPDGYSQRVRIGERGGCPPRICPCGSLGVFGAMGCCNLQLDWSAALQLAVPNPAAGCLQRRSQYSNLSVTAGTVQPTEPETLAETL